MPDRYGGTSAHDAYLRGRKDRRRHPDATTWDGVLPYAVTTLTHAWIAGWYDEAGDYRLTKPDGRKFAYSEVVGKKDGVCPYCWCFGMTDVPDGILRCRLYPCRERNYLPHDKARVTTFMGRLWAGSGI